MGLDEIGGPGASQCPSPELLRCELIRGCAGTLGTHRLGTELTDRSGRVQRRRPDKRGERTVSGRVDDAVIMPFEKPHHDVEKLALRERHLRPSLGHLTNNQYRHKRRPMGSYRLEWCAIYPLDWAPW